MKKILITDRDYKQLDMLLESPTIDLRNSEVLTEFKEMFLAAVAMPKKNISKRVITMNSKVKLRNVVSKNELELTLVYPKESNDEQHKVSVFSDIGIALLGRGLGDIITWQVLGSMDQFEIVEVTRKPKSKLKDIFNKLIPL